MRVIAAVVMVFAVGCKKHEAEPVVVVAAPPKPVPVEADLRAVNGLQLKPIEHGFRITDATGQFQITLPDRPTLSGDLVSQQGVQVFNAQAVMPGTDVDVQFGVMTVPGGDLPPDLSALDQIPDQIATATSGTLVKNQPGTLAGAPARIFELVAGDKRRMFGWYVRVSAHARIYQINCVGEDTPKTRTTCAAVAASFAL